MPHEHSARRRGRFIVPVSLHHQIHVSALPNICIHIITHTYPHHQTRAFISSNTYIHFTAHAFPPPFRGRLRICWHDKSDPYSCERIAIMLLTTCNNAANKLQYTHVHPRNTILSHHKNHTFVLQIPYFYTINTILSHRKNLSATNWEGRKNVLLKSSL